MSDIPAPGETFKGEDGTVSTILPQNYGQDYEASDGELEEYAEYIGINPTTEPALMWIAREGLRTTLPEGWRACQTDEDEVYYFNFQTGESLWDHPMDDHYKNKVTEERAKLKSGKGGPSTSLLGAPSSPAGVKAGLAAMANAVPARTGSTKALTDSFFLKPSSAPLASVPLGEGVSAPRTAPDVSDILGLASGGGAGAPLRTLTSSLPRPGGVGGATPSGGFKLKGVEEALRHQLEEGKEAQLRALRIEYGKAEDAERQKLEEKKASIQKELEEENAGATPPSASISNSNSDSAGAAQRRLHTSREVKQIEESWQKRLHDVGSRVRELQAQVDEKQAALQQSTRQSPEELKKTLEARNAAELAQLREGARRQNEVLLHKAKEEQAAAQAAASQKAAIEVAAAQKAAEGDAARQVAERKGQSERLLAALRDAVAAKRSDFATAEKQQKLKDTDKSGNASNAAAPPTTSGGLSAQDKSTITAAQAAADAEVAQAEEKARAAVSQLEVEYAARKTEAMANRSRSSRDSSAVTSPVSIFPRAGGSATFTGGAATLTAAEQAKLEAEEQKLKEEADRAVRTFEEETELMIANKEAGRSPTAAPPASVAATASAEALAALSRTAAQELRTRDAENGRHSMALKQLESKHEQTVRLLKTQHAKATATTSNAFSPRQHSSFTMLLNTRKRNWLRDHPAPSMEMPTLTTIPALPSAANLLVSSSVTAMPDAAEQATIVKTRLAQVHAEVQQAYDRELKELQRNKEEELKTWQVSYREGRLTAVQKALAQLREEAEKGRAAKSALEASIEASASQQATAPLKAKLEGLQSEVAGLESAAAASEATHKTVWASLTAEIARLEGSLRSLTRAIDIAAAEKQDIEKAEAAQASCATPKKVLLTKLQQPELYMSDAAAEEAETALRNRWTTILQALRDAIQAEMANYERLICELRAWQEAGPSSGGVKGGNTTALEYGMNPPPPLQQDRPGSLSSALRPPPAPQLSGNDGRPLRTSSAGLYVTPVAASAQPPPHWAEASAHSGVNGGTRHVDASLLPLYRTAPGPTSRDLFGVPPSSVAYPDVWGMGAGGGSYSRSGPQRAPSPSMLNSSGLPLSRSSPGRRSPAVITYDEEDAWEGLDLSALRTSSEWARLSALREAVLARRRELQRRRSEMEQLRIQWKADLQSCKEREDKAGVRRLQAAKEVLEARAHGLNEEILQVKTMMRAVEQEVRRYRHDAQSCQTEQHAGNSPNVDTARRTATADALGAGEGEDEKARGRGEPSVDVVDLLQAIMLRTEKLERLLRHKSAAVRE